MVMLPSLEAPLAPHRAIATWKPLRLLPMPATTAPKAIDEMSVADSFIMGVLRGWRLLQAAGLSAEEKRDILSTTRNSLNYDVISQALQGLWDEQLLGHRHHGGGHMNYMDAMDPAYLNYQEHDEELG